MAMASGVPFDPFEALGLERDASIRDIKAQYRKLARRYHPNRQQGPEDSKAGLSEQFHIVHQAWRCLADTDKRRRYRELLQLTEEHADLLSRMSDLLTGTAYQSPQRTTEHDGHVSSDADEDELPAVGLQRRRTVLERKTLRDSPSTRGPPTGRFPFRPDATAQEAPHALSMSATGGKKADYFTLKRKKLEKLQQKELLAFERYRGAMVQKFEAEGEAERTREAYDRAKWKREYFERAPRETAQRFRSFQHFMSAFKAFEDQRLQRRKRQTLSYSGQILSTESAFENSQYLIPGNVNSPSRSKSLRRRGWNSDISGDQTSSDENSSGGYASPGHGLSWTWNKRHDRNTSLDAFQIPPALRPTSTTSEMATDHAPFKMIVKHPTGFNERITGDRESSQDSETTTSRASSQPGGQNSNMFTLVRKGPLCDVFETSLDKERSVLPTPKGAMSKTNGPATDSAGEIRHFTIKGLGNLEHSHVPFENVRELSYAEKVRMLSAQADLESNPAALMERLARLDKNVAERFIIKPDAKESFKFRLIYGRHDIAESQQQSSFIALSYRRQRHVEKKHGYFTLPLDPAMFQAVWDERLSDAEGVWIDQISIDQASRMETTISMSAMDMVYRSARLVVVALDDIELTTHEGEVFEDHMDEYVRMQHVPPTKRFRGKRPPYLETHEDLYQVLQKILRSSWFKRAWCRHEMRLARDHVFLIPYNSSAGERTVVRFTSGCLTHLMALATEVPFERDIELVKPPLHAFFRDRNKLSPEERHLDSHHGNFTTVVAEVLSMETGGDPRMPAKQRAADAMKDKISIVLNTMECGLALTSAMRDPSVLLTKSEYQYMLLIMALAAQDPGALCSVGPPMRLVQEQVITPLSPSASSSWMFEPTNVDSGLNNYRTLNRLPTSTVITTGLDLGEHFVQLDLKILQVEGVHRALESPKSLELAQHFIDVCTRCKYGRNRQRYLITDASANRHFGSMLEVYCQTLSCVFECGPGWFADICHRYGVSRWKQDGEAAWHLLIALKNTDGKWPEDAWSAQAAGFIMDSVNFLVIRGMPQRQIIHREAWRPVWVDSENGGKVLTFVPPGDITPAVPTALLDPDYIHLARLWVLQPRLSFDDPFRSKDGQGSNSWTLLGKSVLFSDDVALQQVDSHGQAWRKQQKVYGRAEPEIQRLLRERSLHF